jgi:hypothetical protein
VPNSTGLFTGSIRPLSTSKDLRIGSNSDYGDIYVETNGGNVLICSSYNTENTITIGHEGSNPSYTYLGSYVCIDGSGDYGLYVEKIHGFYQSSMSMDVNSGYGIYIGTAYGAAETIYIGNDSSTIYLAGNVYINGTLQTGS